MRVVLTVLQLSFSVLTPLTSFRVFINNVRSIKILSPSEVFHMQDGMGLLAVQRQTSSSSEDGTTQQDSRNPSSVITSACSLDY